MGGGQFGVGSRAFSRPYLSSKIFVSLLPKLLKGARALKSNIQHFINQLLHKVHSGLSLQWKVWTWMILPGDLITLINEGEMN